MKKVVRNLVSIFVLLVATPARAFDDCNAIYVGSEDSHTPGKCTSFPECPVLFDIIKSPSKTASEIKLIQKLTCKPDDKNPLVCCAIDDIVSVRGNNVNDYAIRPSNQNSNDPNDAIVFEFDKGSSSSNAKEKQIHPNFSLMPKVTECGSAVGSDRIIGGELASILEFPWLARIGYYSFEDDTIKYLCAGTVINKRYIMTAAHCTQEINPDDYEPRLIRLAEPDAVADDIYNISKPVDIEIEKIIPHENYNKRDKSNDIGLIRLKKDIPYGFFIQPVCLPFVEEYGLTKEEVDPTLAEYADTGEKSTKVAGWGKTQWNDREGSPHLLKVSLPVISQEQCQKNYENHARVKITEKQLCAGGEKGQDSCGGDSGGGLFIPRSVRVVKSVKKPLTFQFGTVSFGPTSCGVGGLPGVYTNIYAYKKWILDNIEP